MLFIWFQTVNSNAESNALRPMSDVLPATATAAMATAAAALTTKAAALTAKAAALAAEAAALAAEAACTVGCAGQRTRVHGLILNPYFTRIA